MKITLLISMITLTFAVSAHAKSDLACSLDQKVADASGNVAALLARGYVAGGGVFEKQGGGLNDASGEAVYSEVLNLDLKLSVNHQVESVNGIEESTYTLVNDNRRASSDRALFNRILAVSVTASKNLSEEDQAALNECNAMVGKYIGVIK